MPSGWLIQRNVPRNKIRSNPVIVPTMRSLCRVTKRSMILLRADASAKNIMRDEIMGRHYLFWLRPNGLRHVISWIHIGIDNRFQARAKDDPRNHTKSI